MTEPQNETKPQADPKHVEILAFFLHCQGEATDDQAQKNWQASSEIREQYRRMARQLLEQLHDQGGLRLRVGDSRAQNNLLTWLMTVPPRPAYTPEELALLNPV